MKQEKIDELQALLDAWYSPIRRDGVKFYDTDGDVLATFDFESEAKMFMDLHDAAPALLEAARENLRLRAALQECRELLHSSMIIDCDMSREEIETANLHFQALGKEAV